MIAVNAKCDGPTDLLKAALHGLVNQQSHGSHQVSDENEVAFGLSVESNDIVGMVALHT